jgi:transposase
MVKGKPVSSHIGATVEALAASGFKVAAVIKHLKGQYRGRRRKHLCPSKSWIYQRYSEVVNRGPGRPQQRQKKPGPSKILTTDHLQFVLNLLQTRIGISTRSIRHELYTQRNVSCSKWTVTRALNAQRWVSRARPVKRIAVTPKLRAQRLEFAQYIKENLPRPEFKAMLFATDETRISISGPDRIGSQQWYWIPNGPPYKIVPRLKDMGGTLFCSFISQSGCAQLNACSELENNPGKTMNKERYKEMLNTYFRATVALARQTAAQKYPNAHINWSTQPAYLIQDGAKPHIARIIKTWLRKNPQLVSLLQLPPYSPDLNPIEKMWAELKRRLYDRLELPWHDQSEVDAAAKATWIELTNDTEYVERVVGNLFSTCEKVIAANGGYV